VYVHVRVHVRVHVHLRAHSSPSLLVCISLLPTVTKLHTNQTRCVYMQVLAHFRVYRMYLLILSPKLCAGLGKSTVNFQMRDTPARIRERDSCASMQGADQ
jgi:hypothetical protein